MIRQEFPAEFDGIDQPRAHEYVAEQIRREIMLRVIPAGHALPPERELARMFRVGRATVQLAIQVLERDGLISKRRGRTGGSFVADPVTDGLGMQHLLKQLRRDQVLIEEALVFRSEIEPPASAHASRVRTASDLARMNKASRGVASARTDATFMKFDTQFHIDLGRATHNRMFVDAIERIRLVLNDALLALPESDLWHQRTQREHASILTAIELGDAKAAERATLLHIRHTEEGIRALLTAL